jgi:hypothetical protein
MRHIVFLSAIIWLCFPGGFAAAAPHGHYLVGLEGIKAASMPPEGLYWSMGNVYYTANQLQDGKGKRPNTDLRAKIFVMSNAFIYSTPIEILGGNLLVLASIPVSGSDIYIKVDGVKPGHLNGSRFNVGELAVGDIAVHPLRLAWHGERWDAVAGAGVYMPTGSFKANEITSPGSGFWTFMGTLGATLYLDAEKTWSASILTNYEIHTERWETRTTLGNDFHVEWGIGKTFNQTFTIGAAGYGSWQMTKDTGKNVANAVLQRSMGIGPEIGFHIPDWKCLITLRSIWEFENRNTTQGVTTALVFTKYF